MSWPRELTAQKIFEQALQHDRDQRQAFVHGACGDDPALLNRVLGLLQADRSAGDFLASPLTAPTPGWSEAASAATGSDTAQRKIGPYRIVSAIGEGGSSRVFLAQREDGDFHQRVAIKLLRRDHRSADNEQRFRREARFLAALEHRNVARLLDSGLTEDNHPYLVMEYVEGEPILDYCDIRRLTLDQRLEVFREVCATVRFAHQNLIVHRDLKPANILITEDGLPKLLDFGIAKLLEPDGNETGTATEFRVATPNYSSPEHMAGGSITTATDVYSLGVLLFQLLAGCRPYETAGRTVFEILALVREQKRPRMSNFLLRPEQAQRLATSAEQRQTSPPRLVRALRGDLDRIVAKALEVEVEERYSTVGDLDEDLRRYQRGMPIRPDSRSLLRLVLVNARRKPLVTAATCFLLLSLLAAGAGTVWHLARVDQERQKAMQAQLRAERVVEFLVSVFDTEDPKQGRGQDLTVLDAIQKGAATLDTRLQDEPQVRAEIRHAIGRIYFEIGAAEEARQELRKAIETRQSLGLEAPLSDSLLSLGSFDVAIGDLEAAEEALGRALEIRQRLDGPTSDRIADVLFAVSGLRGAQADFTGAEELHERALEIRRQAGTDPDWRVAASLKNLASIYRATGRYDLAVDSIREAIDIETRRAGADDLAVGHLLNTLGRIHNSQGRFADAESALLRAKSIIEAVRPTDHLDLATVMHNLTVTYGNIGDYRSAETHARGALSIKRKRLGENHPRIAGVMLNLANLADLQGRRREAMELYQQTADLAIERYGRQHDFVASLLFNIATVHRALGQFDAAAQHFQQAMESYLANHDNDDDVVADCLTGLGELDRLRGNWELAAGYLARAENIFRAASDSHPNLAWTLRNLAFVDLAHSRLNDAAGRFREALELRRAVLDPLHPALLDSKVDQAEMLALLGRPAEARALLHGIFESSDELARDPSANPEQMVRIAAAHLALATHSDSATERSEHAAKALGLLTAADLDLIDARNDLARASWLTGDRATARRLGRELDQAGWHDPRLEALRTGRTTESGGS